MIKATFEQLVEIISRHSGVPQDEIKRMVEAKRAKLSGLISKEGAAQVIAAELGVSFDRQKVKISEILEGMKRISVTARVLQVFPIRDYSKGNISGRVLNIMVGDETGSIRAVFWDTNHITMFESGRIKEGSTIEIKDATLRTGELHLGSISKLSLSDRVIDANVIKKEILHEKVLAELKENEKAKVRAVVVQTFEPRFFYTCPECAGRVVQDAEKFSCAKHGAVVPIKNIIFTMVLDDGTENLRAVSFKDVVQKLFNASESEITDINFFLQKKNEIIGKEYWLEGRARQNKMFNNIEFVLNSVEEVKPQELIERLDNK
ncbi:DUF2240 family protein [Candidatus Pacearchaeota archaeon]|nr:DUF2240 family protein [Candidatus Pacearchaeota archaeon]